MPCFIDNLAALEVFGVQPGPSARLLSKTASVRTVRRARLFGLGALGLLAGQAVPVSIYFITAFEIVGGSGRKVVLNR